MRRIDRQAGLSLLELLLVVATLAGLAAISFPLLGGPLQRAHASGAGDALAGAIRDARMRAIATGWQYRVVAFDAAGTVPNAFRIEGINPAAGGVWPLAGTAATPPSYGPNQTYEAYTNLPQDFGTAQIQVPGGGPFTVTFNTRGQWATPCIPLGCQAQMRTAGGLTTLTVSQSGVVQVVKQ